MKKIFIYYSLSGNGDLIGDYFKDKKVPIRKIITKEPLPKNKILQLLTGGFKATINYKDKLDNFNNDISDYDEIIIGSPIWNNRLSSPINTVLTQLDFTNKILVFVLYSGSGKDNKAISYIRKNYPKAQIINLKEPKNNTNEMIKQLGNLFKKN